MSASETPCNSLKNAFLWGPCLRRGSGKYRFVPVREATSGAIIWKLENAQCSFAGYGTVLADNATTYFTSRRLRITSGEIISNTSARLLDGPMK